MDPQALSVCRWAFQLEGYPAAGHFFEDSVGLTLDGFSPGLYHLGGKPWGWRKTIHFWQSAFGTQEPE